MAHIVQLAVAPRFGLIRPTVVEILRNKSHYGSVLYSRKIAPQEQCPGSPSRYTLDGLIGSQFCRPSMHGKSELFHVDEGRSDGVW